MPQAFIGKGDPPVSDSQPKSASNARTIAFMVILSFICALILSLLASALAEPKEIAKDLDRSKQMMIAAKIFTHEGYFLMKDAEGKYIPAKYSKDGILVPGTTNDIATNSQILEVYKRRLKPLLVDDKGNIVSFEKAGINMDEYIAKNKKTGYYKQPYKLAYEILPNPKPDEKPGEKIEPEGFVIPVNGYGLWDAIYGYLAIKPDGNTIIGISWYDQKETPGLGANIAEPAWQSLFPGKHIFQESPDGKTNYKLAPLGITVVRGKVSEALGNSPKALSAVDGMAGATLTGNGVTDAYSDVLAPYRPFLIKIHDEYKKSG
jgi:Na+-transporting NADH:ubiquinone oxidoreductase subunit C